MKVIGFTGHCGSGKTTLIERLIPVLKQRGLRVSVIKHAQRGLEVDHAGKDSWRHRQAGAFEVVTASPQRLVLMREFEQTCELSVHQLIAHLYDGVDWVLVEGFGSSSLQKIEAWRAANGSSAGYPEDPFIVAIATDDPAQLPAATLRPLLDLNDADAVADWLLDNAGRFDYDPEMHL